MALIVPYLWKNVAGWLSPQNVTQAALFSRIMSFGTDVL